MVQKQNHFLQAMAISMETQPGYCVSEKSVPDTSSTYSATPSAPETKTMSSLQFNNLTKERQVHLAAPVCLW